MFIKILHKIEKALLCSKSFIKNISVTDNEVRILLIGKTKVGKSTTANAILGHYAFETRLSVSSCTTKTELREAQRFGKQLLVVDTPGLFHSSLTEEETLAEICKWSSLVPRGVHCIILIVQADRFMGEDQKTVDLLIKLFGDDLKKFLIVVFTNKHSLDEHNMSIDEFVEIMDRSLNLRNLIEESKRRFIAIGCKEDENHQENEVKQVFSMIKKIIQNEGKCYSAEIFEKIQIKRRKLEKSTLKRIIDLLNGIRNRFTRGSLLILTGFIAMYCIPATYDIFAHLIHTFKTILYRVIGLE